MVNNNKINNIDKDNNNKIDKKIVLFSDKLYLLLYIKYI